MIATSKHVFGALASAASKAPSRRDLIASVLGSLALGVLPIMPAAAPAHVHIEMTLTAGSPWLDRLNSWRDSTGVPLLTENTLWSQGDYNHALYMVKNDLVTHYETPGVPYYTTAGDVAAQNSNIQVSSTTNTTDAQIIDWWMQAPFHAMGLMDPRLGSTGFGSYREVKSGWQEGAAVDTLRGNSWSGGQYPVYFPGNGASEPLTTYGGGEYPDPLQACPGYSAPTGLPAFIQVGGNVATTVTAHSFTGNGVLLAHCVIDSTSASIGSGLVGRGGVIVVPRQPLQSGVRYVVSLTVNGVPYTWSFTVGPFSTCTSMTASAAPASQAAAGVPVTITATSTGCINPRYEFWILPPGGTWTAGQSYSASSTFTWNTTGNPAGSYRFSVWARDASSPNSYDAFNAFQYMLTSTGCSAMSATSSPPSTAISGAKVTITGSATGCSNPLYEFWLLITSGMWTLAQSYSTNAVLSLNTAGMPVGSYRFSVWVRDAGSFNSYDAFSAFQYALTGTSCSAMSASSAPPSTATAGTPVTVTGSATGCASPLYEFWLLPPGGSWALAQPYSSTATFNWNTSGKGGGSYRFSVWARDASSPGSSGTSPNTYDAFSAFQYTLAAACSAMTASSSPASMATAGNTVTITASASGCSNPLYEFWVLPPGGSWTLAQAYSASSTLSWITVGKAKGSYRISVWARDASSAGTNGTAPYTYDSFSAFVYALT